MVSDTPRMIEHGTSRTGRWLRPRRTRIALWIAVAEGILVAFLHDFTKWTVIIVAIPLILLYMFWGRTARSDTARESCRGEPGRYHLDRCAHAAGRQYREHLL